MNRPNILIIAQNASSIFGGEAILPLKYFQLLKRRGYTVHLIAHVRNRKDLQSIFGPGADGMLFIKDSIYHRIAWRLGRLTPMVIRDHLFGTILNMINECYQSKIIRQLIKQGKVDIIHQPIPVSPMAPSSIYGLACR